MRLSMKQLVPTSLDEYIAEHKVGDVVTGRVIDTAGQVRVELGEGIQAICRQQKSTSAASPDQASGKADMSSLGAMLQARWKGASTTGAAAKADPLSAGQVRSFRITKLDGEKKSIEVEAA